MSDLNNGVVDACSLELILAVKAILADLPPGWRTSKYELNEYPTLKESTRHVEIKFLDGDKLTLQFESKMGVL